MPKFFATSANGELLTVKHNLKFVVDFENAVRNVPIVLPILRTTPGGGVLPYMGHIGMCRCEGYGFQAVYSSIGYINQSV